jgi:hypothetical protein
MGKTWTSPGFVDNHHHSEEIIEMQVETVCTGFTVRTVSPSENPIEVFGRFLHYDQS